MAIANLVIASVGPAAVPYVAFAAIGPILTLRDRLQDAWGLGRGFLLKMGGLIAAGGLIAFLLTPGVAGLTVAIAALVAFVASEIADTVIYTLLRNKAKHVRVNVSNAASALVDSYVFLTIAFGSVPFAVMFSQFTGKVAGGALFLVVLGSLKLWRDNRRVESEPA